MMQFIDVQIKIMDHYRGLPLPDYATFDSAGIDLMAAIQEDIIIKPNERVLIDTGIAIALPEKYVADIRPRSGLALKYGITVLNSPGTIDADYRGEIKVILINHGTEYFTVTRGMRIAQMLVFEVEKIRFIERSELAQTTRGSGGFGSTGATKKRNIVFMGTSYFATQILKVLSESLDNNITAVYTKPAKESGRGQLEKNTAVFEMAKELGINEIYTHSSLAKVQPPYDTDIVVVVDYGVMLTESFLKGSQKYTINIHPSLLPRWRGAAPISRAIMEGDKKTGLTIMHVIKELDAGDIVFQEELIINAKDNFDTLEEKLISIASANINSVIGKLLENEINAVKQDPTLVTYAKKISDEELEIDWNTDTRDILLKIRGLSRNNRPFLSAIDGIKLHIISADCVVFNHKHEPGTWFVDSKSLIITCNDGFVSLVKIVPENRRAMHVKDFLNVYFYVWNFFNKH